MKPLVIFDLDGTLSDASHRQHLVQGANKDYRAFYLACYRDPPKRATIAVAEALRDAGYECWLFSGRSAEVLPLTTTWLFEHCPGVFTVKKFRPEGDYTPDDKLKMKWYDEMSGEDQRRLMLVFDDRDRMVAMWRSLGVPCFQVAPGAF